MRPGGALALLLRFRNLKPTRKAVLAPLALALLLARAALAQDPATPDSATIPSPVGHVNDFAGVMEESSRAQLEGFLDQVKQKTGAELAVLTVKTTAPLTPDEYKVKVFERWGIGRAGEDNGLLLLVAIDERQAKFETGYGLEGVLPDGLQSRIFRELMRPRFQQDDYTGGIIAGMLEAARRIAAEKGVTLEWNGRELRYTTSRRSGLPFRVILLIVVIVIAIILSNLSNSGRGGPRRRNWMGPGWGGGFGGGFGGFGGGGFGGGGGGGGFGGFGGGHSGGGGGGGSW